MQEERGDPTVHEELSSDSYEDEQIFMDSPAESPVPRNAKKTFKFGEGNGFSIDGFQSHTTNENKLVG